MKEQLRAEIERVWKNRKSYGGTPAELERMSTLTVILRDLEAADASAAATRLADASYHVTMLALK